MRSIVSACLHRIILIGASFGTVLLVPVFAAEDPPAESPLVKMLKSGKLPEERQSTIVEMLGKRGGPSDLAFLFQQAIRADGFPSAVRLKALNGLAEAALTRQVKPEVDLNPLGAIIKAKGDPLCRSAGVRLAGLWKVEGLVSDLRTVAQSSETSESLRAGALDALASIGGKAGRAGIVALAGTDQPNDVRILAVAALTKLDVVAATEKAVTLLKDAAGGHYDPSPLLAAFLNLQGGSDKLASALAANSIPADSAKLALRSIYALGRTDANLVAELTKAAGLNAEVQPLDQAALDRLMADVAAKGNPERGEKIFRRADLNCSKCHALSGAGGGIGPELSPIGSSSPVDYIINSIMLPDQAIKEEYHTKIVLTNDGRIYQGIVVDKDEKRLILKEATGEQRTIPAADIEADKDGGSLMPKGLVNFMTRGELVDLVRFLSELGKPGPFAIRATPSIQRWRCLKPVPDELARAVPDTGTFKAQLLGVDPDRWLPAYGKVGGGLPLDEVSAATGGKTVYLQGEVDVSTAGTVTFRLDSDQGVHAWVDDKAVATGPSVSAPLEVGRHKLTLRIDTAAHKGSDVKVEVTKSEGSPVEFAVVGGR
jgi:putative heme-binding domain-containing protein